MRPLFTLERLASEHPK